MKIILITFYITNLLNIIKKNLIKTELIQENINYNKYIIIYNYHLKLVNRCEVIGVHKYRKIFLNHYINNYGHKK